MKTHPLLSFESIRTVIVASVLLATAGVSLAATNAAIIPANLPVTVAEEGRLVRLAKSTLLSNVTMNEAWAPYRGIMPSKGEFHGIWNWDAAFIAVGVSHWDAALAREQFDIMFDKQLPNGMLPDVIRENGTMVTNVTKPPVMAWAVAVVDHRTPDDGYLRGIYPKLVKLGEFWMKERGGEKDGLFFYAGADVGYDSGWDDAIRWDNGYRFATNDDHRLWAVDLNCYMLSHYRAMAYIAGRLGLKDDQTKWLAASDALAKRINEKLWDDHLGAYVDRDGKTGENGPALSPATFMPLFVHIAPPDRAARMIKLAGDPAKFYPGMPTAAYDTKGYDPTGYWRGRTWLNTAFFAIKGLKDYGAVDLADDFRKTILGWVARDSAIRENYNSRTGEGLGAKGFGWSATFALAFILDWDNDNLTWCFPSVGAQIESSPQNK